MKDPRFVKTILFYVGLAILAGFTLDGRLREFTWIFLAAIALRTWLVVVRRDIQ